MSAVIVHPIFNRLQRDMAQMFSQPATVADLHAERVRREREASERRFRERHGYSVPDFDGPEAA